MTTRRRKIKRNLLGRGLASALASPGAAERIFGPDEPPPPYATPLSSVKTPPTEEEISEMERSYNDFLELRRKRTLEGIGREQISDEPFIRE